MNKERLTKAVVDYQKGNDDALATIYEEVNQNLYIYAKYITKSPEKAEDLLQETFVEIIKSVDSLNDPTAFLTWSKRIMWHISRHDFKREGREVVSDDEEFRFEQICDEDRDYLPEEHLNIGEIKRIVLDTLEELPVQQRVAMLAFYLDEMSISEIAELMDSPENTVKTRLHYGRIAVKTKLEEYEKKHDIRLHSIAPIPFILLTLKSISSNTEYVLAAEKASEIFASITTSAGVSVTTHIVGSSSSTAIAKAFIGKKIVGSIIAICLAGGIGGGLIAHHFSADKPKTEGVAQLQGVDAAKASASANLSGGGCAVADKDGTVYFAYGHSLYAVKDDDAYEVCNVWEETGSEPYISKLSIKGNWIYMLFENVLISGDDGITDNGIYKVQKTGDSFQEVIVSTYHESFSPDDDSYESHLIEEVNNPLILGDSLIFSIDSLPSDVNALTGCYSVPLEKASSDNVKLVKGTSISGTSGQEHSDFASDGKSLFYAADKEIKRRDPSGSEESVCKLKEMNPTPKPYAISMFTYGDYLYMGFDTRRYYSMIERDEETHFAEKDPSDGGKSFEYYLYCVHKDGGKPELIFSDTNVYCTAVYKGCVYYAKGFIGGSNKNKKTLENGINSEGIYSKKIDSNSPPKKIYGDEDLALVKEDNYESPPEIVYYSGISVINDIIFTSYSWKGNPLYHILYVDGTKPDFATDIEEWDYQNSLDNIESEDIDDYGDELFYDEYDF